MKLNNWEELACEDDQLLAQRGGAMVLDESEEVVFDHVDPGILGYCDPKRLIQFVTKATERRARPSRSCTKRAKRKRRRRCERYHLNVQKKVSAMSPVTRSTARGLIYTTGTATGDGFYFPVKAVQCFGVQNERIRNGVYVGPVKLFFDGPFSWKQNMQMLEFAFTKYSVGVGSLVRVRIGDSKWESTKRSSN